MCFFLHNFNDNVKKSRHHVEKFPSIIESDHYNWDIPRGSILNVYASLGIHAAVYHLPQNSANSSKKESLHDGCERQRAVSL